jgi:hypothetical protein
MTRLTIAFLVCAAAAAACSKQKTGEPTTASGGTGESTAVAPALPAKKLVLSWGISPVGELADIFLATTDETGKQVSHKIGRYKGTCEKFTPAKEMNALTGVACRTGGGGTELHAVQRGDEVVVVVMGTTPGVAPDPMAREAVTSVSIPTGIAVEVAP